MIPPKYKFYIAKNLAVSLQKGYVIDDETGRVLTLSTNGDKYTLSSYLDVDTLGQIFITAKSFTYCTISMYDKSSTFLGTTRYLNADINAGTNIVFKENTKSIRIGFFELEGPDTIATGTVVNPHYNTLSKKYAKESNQEFFRVTLDGKLTLFDNDYGLVKKASINDKLLFYVLKYNDGTGVWDIYYSGEFNKTDCTLNYDKKSCALKLTAHDAYTDILAAYENKYDLIKLAPALTSIKAYKRSLIQVYIRGANTISNFFGGTYWEEDVNEVVDDKDDLKNKYYFSYILAGNELYVQGSANPDINDVYAGTNGYWISSNGKYVMYTKQEKGSTYRLYIKSIANDLDLYKSEGTAVFPDPNDKSLSEAAFEMTGSFNFNDITSLGQGPCEVYQLFEYQVYQRLLCDVDQVSYGGTITPTYDLPINDFVSDNRNYKKCIGMKGGTFFCSSRTVDEPTRYGINDYGKYFTSNFIPSIAGYGKPLPISRSSWVNASLWYVYNDDYASLEMSLRKAFTLKDNYSIGAAIKVLLKKMGLGLKHEETTEYSNFLYSNSPSIPMDERFWVCITQKSNILKGEYDQAAQKAEISLKTILDMLCKCFRCYWYIDGNKLKIEHVKFFINGGSYGANSSQLDFTKVKDAFNKKNASYFQSEITYAKEDLNQRYEFNWMDDSTDLFDGVTIDVKANYVQKGKTEEVSVQEFSSDIDFMMFDPSNFSEDGFALLCPVKTGSDFIMPVRRITLKDEDASEYEAIVQNYYASWPYLINFYMYDMPAADIECNARDIDALGVKACMEHEILVQTENDMGVYKNITTEVGQGVIDEMTIDFNTRVSKIKLVYSPQ